MSEEFWRRFDLLYNRTSEAAIKTGAEQRLVNVELKKGDVLIAGYPKTGTTWVQQILHQLRTGGDESFTDIYSVTKYIPYHFEVLPTFDPNFPEQPHKPRVFKNHDRYQWVPKAQGLKYICTTRDELDAMLSMAKFVVSFICGGTEELDSKGLLRFMQSAAFKSAGNYKEWMLSWYPHRNDPNVLWVHFEDLVQDLPTCVRKIAAFAGIPLSAELEKLVVERSSFDYMVKHKEKFVGDEGITMAMKQAINEEWKPEVGMVREGGGKVGEGKKQITPEVRKWFADEWEATIGAKLGLHNYEELRAQSSLLRH